MNRALWLFSNPALLAISRRFAGDWDVNVDAVLDDIARSSAELLPGRGCAGMHAEGIVLDA
jgi:hypothetical protein